MREIVSSRCCLCASDHTANRVISDQEHNCTDDSDKQTVKVRPGHTTRPKSLKEKAADRRTYDSQQDVKEKPFTFLVNELAPNETHNQTQHDPSED